MKIGDFTNIRFGGKNRKLQVIAVRTIIDETKDGVCSYRLYATQSPNGFQQYFNGKEYILSSEFFQTEDDLIKSMEA